MERKMKRKGGGKEREGREGCWEEKEGPREAGKEAGKKWSKSGEGCVNVWGRKE